MNPSWPELLARLEADLGAWTGVRDSLRGERNAIPDDAERGYGLLRNLGGIACHQGVDVGGDLFQKFGIFQDPLAPRPAVTWRSRALRADRRG